MLLFLISFALTISYFYVLQYQWICVKGARVLDFQHTQYICDICIFMHRIYTIEEKLILIIGVRIQTTVFN